MKIDLNRTERGFLYGEFTDKYGQKCSLQKSSRVADGPGDECIWLGVDNPDSSFKVCHNGWRNYTLREFFPEGDILVPDRMHLTQEMVKMLLPSLQHFAETGELPEPKTELKEYCKYCGAEDCSCEWNVEPDHPPYMDGMNDGVKDIESRLTAIICDQLVVKLKPIDYKDTYLSLNFDSLDCVELMMYIEEEFRFEITEEEESKMSSMNFGDLIKFVRSKTNKSTNKNNLILQAPSPYMDGMNDGVKDCAVGKPAMYLQGDQEGADSKSHAEYIDGYLNGYA